MSNSFDRIAGYENEKRELQDVCSILKNIEGLKRMKCRFPRGILLVGNPGVGKTVLAECLIAECGLYTVRVDDNGLRGKTILKGLKEKFTEAAENAPSVIFIDEMDKLLGENTVEGSISDLDASQAFIRAIDKYVKGDVMLLATANDKNMFSYALRRSGRFDRTIRFSTPSVNDRKEIFKFYFSGRPIDKQVSIDRLVKITGGQTGADIECLVNEAALNAVVNGHNTIKNEDFEKALNKMIFEGCEKKAPVDKERARVVATHEVGHLMAQLFTDINSVASVSIVPQCDASGHCKMADTEIDYTIEGKKKLITVALAGKAAEKVFYPNKSFFGGSRDYVQAYNIAKELITIECIYGLEYLIPQNPDWDGMCRSFTISAPRVSRIDEKIMELMNECRDQATKIITENIELAKIYIEKLLRNKTLSEETIIRTYNKNQLKKNA